MNLLKICTENPFVPQKCCGIEAGVGAALVTGGFGVLSSVATNETNKDINSAQLRFSANEAEKQRQFQKDEWTRQYQLQRDEWYKQLHAQSEQQWLNYLREAEYNTPKAQIGRMTEVGLNPSAVLGNQGSSGLVSASTGNVHSAATPSVPSGGSVSGSAASVPSMIPMQNPMQGQLSAIGSFIRDIAAANKDDKTVEPFVQLLGQQVIGQQLQNEWQSFNNEILSKIKDVKVKKEFQELENLAIHGAMEKELTGFYNSQTLLNKANEALAIAKKRCTEEEYNVLSFQVLHLYETWSAQMKLIGAQANQANASASYSNALTETENSLRQFKVDNADLVNTWQTLTNGLVANDYKVSDAIVEQRIKTTTRELVAKFRQAKIITEREQVELDKAIKEKNWFLVQHILIPLINAGANASPVNSIISAGGKLVQ